MKRREFIALVGGAAVWPLVAAAQQSALPIVGFLRPTRAEESGHLVAAVRQGLRESGYSNDRVAIETRWGNGHPEQLPKLAAELVAVRAAVLIVNNDGALIAKKTAPGIPTIFVTGADPIAMGLVSSINRPGGNITGVSFNTVPVTGKRLELLRQLVPKAEVIAVLLDRLFASHETEANIIKTAAGALGLRLIMFEARTEHDIDGAFAEIAKSGAGALLIGSGQLFTGRRSQLIGLAALHGIATSFAHEEEVAAGGLIAYGASQTDTYRRAGIYAARILNGEKAGDLPIESPDRYKLAINLKTARALGLVVPPTLLARADEVIE